MKRVASGTLPIVTIDRKSPKALYQQICDAYRAAILGGSLRPGQRIPSTRLFAAELGVSRFPVLNAYAQLLAEGYFESRVGAGTVVSNLIPDRFTTTTPSKASAIPIRSGPRPVAKRTSILAPSGNKPWLRGFGAFGVGQVAFDQFPLQAWAKLVVRHSRDMTRRSFHYGDQMGSPALREAVAKYLRTARSVHCEAEQVMIVGGSQQALEISARVLFDPGSHVWVEEPGYLYARETVALAGCNLVPVSVDHEGLDVAAGVKRCPKARAAIVTPSHQFPLGVTMSASRRFQLLKWAQSNGSWIIEDDYDSEYRYETSPIVSLQGLDVNARVIYIGTFSKVLFPSLRLGYVVVPPDLLGYFLTIKRAMDLGQPAFYQDVLADFIREGHFERHIRRMRILYRERRSALIDNIREHLGPIVGVMGGEAGMHLSITLPDGSNDVEIAERAAQQNLWIWPLSSSYLEKPGRPGFILGFGSTSVEEIPRAVLKLRSLLKS
jgi:GntR family transcriptional regulator/MocR family aminotransferase